jgi:D-glycero-alpha-D-manno-heptose 1-phosphate guanylyltransferase
VAVVLAGGLGTRIRHLLADVPKPMAPVEGRPFVEWVVRYLAGAGVRRVLLSTGHMAAVVARHFKSQPVNGVAVQCVPEPQPLGTAGGFLHAAAACPKAERPPFWLVLNGDSLVFADLKRLFLPLADPSVAGAILGLKLADASRYGTLVCGPDGGLEGFREKQPGAGVINAGVYLLRAGLLEGFPTGQPLSFEREVFPALAARKTRLQVVVAEAPFLDIGTPETLVQAAEFLRCNGAAFGPSAPKPETCG